MAALGLMLLASSEPRTITALPGPDVHSEAEDSVTDLCCATGSEKELMYDESGDFKQDIIETPNVYQREDDNVEEQLEEMLPELILVLTNDITDKMISQMGLHQSFNTVQDHPSYRKHLKPFLKDDEIIDNESIMEIDSLDPLQSSDSQMDQIHLMNAEHSLQIAARELEERNRTKRIKNAWLLYYLQMLHTKLKLKPVDFDRPWHKILEDFNLNWTRIKTDSEKFKLDVVQNDNE